MQPGRRAAQAKSGAAHALAVDEGRAVLLVLGARHPQLVLRAHAAQVRVGVRVRVRVRLGLGWGEG